MQGSWLELASAAPAPHCGQALPPACTLFLPWAWGRSAGGAEVVHVGKLEVGCEEEVGVVSYLCYNMEDEEPAFGSPRLSHHL